MKRHELFPTPLYLSRPAGSEALRAELKEQILAEARSSEGILASNLGGWHSRRDLLTRPDACYQALARLMLEGFRAVVADAAGGQPVDPKQAIGGSAWAMLMEDGHYSRPHHHGDAHWAGVFYVDAGDTRPEAPPLAGHLSFIDPRGGMLGTDPLRVGQAAHDLRPVDGLLVFFPGWLIHHVHPYRGTRPRLTISCNLQLRPS